jgi:hypothetical protein
MIWIGRLAILFCGFIVAAAFMNLLLISYTLIAAHVLRIRSETFYGVMYWVCLAIGSIASFWLMRQVWLRSRPRVELVK